MRRGRFSQSHADYFLTLTTEARLPGLTALPASASVSEELTRMENDATWTVRCSCVMPDHLHLLIRLGERLSLERAVQRLKAKTGAALRLAGCTWARGFFDRRLRPDDERLGVFLYVFLNPY
jgi:REP element-mobilizing transposase RayT